MAGKNKVMLFLSLCCAGMMVIPFIASCGKSGSISPSSSKIQMQVVNLSPDLQPIYLYVGLIRQSQAAYSYPYPSGYFSLTNIDTPIQIRSANSTISTTNFVSLDSVLKPNFKYTLFVTGLRADSTVTSIFAIDTARTPTPGRAKIRFINASPRSAGFDITANGTMAFRNQTYKNISKFIEVPPGNYEFKIMPAGQTTVISSIPGVTVADGKVYTIYCRGVAGGADSVAFGTGVIINR
ncbi:DUF4397 domain-containing protein [Mucilaginibacter sp. UR6-11]|uniref:DUF4397 domain-containing protein n=1 Tax=Mucilaginibacter sp. UR6-11 TaxID=1435644 RepID=UPI001E55DF53|nr:DUF4397 domain-containing protein [Mucilaginibacter sp. UR6-11]MCC8424024.1 DUF4397 domain-containing protein [Mucilaginibacter sp. UR6-11]